MENETQNARDATNVTRRSIATSPVFDVARPVFPTATSAPITNPTPPTPSQSPPSPQITPRKLFSKRPNWKIIGLSVLTLIILIGGGFIFWKISTSTSELNSQQKNDATTQFSPLSISLSEISKGHLVIDASRSLSVNGQLKVNNSLIISPTTKPTTGVAGQIYYDQTTNKLAYFDGQGYVDLLSSGDSVTSLGGVSGALTLGGGLSSAGNVLSNSSVLSVQGQTGSVAFTAGAGMAISGTTLSNTGILSLGGRTGDISLGTGLSIDATNTLKSTGTQSLTSGSASLVITNNGNGNLTISNVGAGGGANTALSNLTGVAINTSLLPGSAGGIDLGSGTLPLRDIYLAGSSGTPGTNNFKITGASTSGTRTITLPDASGTVCLQSSASCGFAPTSGGTGYIQNSTSSQNANIYLTSATAGGTIARFQSPLGGTGDLLQLANSLGIIMLNLDSTGIFTQKPTTNGVTFQIQTAAGTNQLAVDTSNNRVIIGPSAGDTTGTITVFGNKTNSGDPTGVAGAMYYNASSKVFRCYQNGFWQDCIATARTSYHYTNELISDAADSQTGPFSSGGGATSAVNSGLTGHPGIVSAGTGAGSTAWAAMGSVGQGSEVLLANGDYWRYETVLRVPTLSTASERFYVAAGFLDNRPSAIADGCFLQYKDDVNSGKWEGKCINGGASSTCDTGITAAANTWTRLTVVVGTSGLNTEFFVNGTSACSIILNIPQTATHEVSFGTHIEKTAGTTDRYIDMDYLDIQAQFGTPR